MKVTGCETLHCDAGWRDFSFLKVTTDEGITGISEYNECYGSPGLSGVIERVVANWVVGEDPMAVSRVGAKLYAATRQAPGGIVQQAIAAVENALLDIKGKALGVRVCDLLGGPVRDRLDLYWSHCGTYRFGAPARYIDRPPIETLDDLARLAGEIRDRGFRALKTNIFLFGEDGPRLHMPGFIVSPGWPELNADPQVIDALRRQLGALREGAGPDIGIHLDLNFNFKTEGYLQVARALD
ncbi:MAG: mandelate racemase/muconate lactonizing enzyme family protein, partial [Gammaproteobacteria bacterium]|nr:mandelate racemase/muconate lactonizing enzyme family protein [Gammaproteobacteria bacterium]